MHQKKVKKNLMASFSYLKESSTNNRLRQKKIGISCWPIYMVLLLIML
jgi:hypothetical protein